SKVAAISSGVFAAIALFFSYEIGVYTIVGAFVSIVVLGLLATRVPGALPRAPTTARTAALFALGLLLGAATFVVYLVARGALGPFFETSFVVIPKFIDAVWSMPFPDLLTTFRKDLNVHALADFVVREQFHLILSPLTIAVAAAYLIQRAV